MGGTALKKENISDAVIRRLPRYYRQLTDLRARGVVRISSHSLGQEMNITASQIRQDFSCFGEFGQQGYGYNVEELRTEIGHILGVDNHHHLIMIGVGNLGHALLQNFNFSHVGFSVDAAFDISPLVVGSSVNGVPIYAMDELDAFIQADPPVCCPGYGGPASGIRRPGLLEFYQCGTGQQCPRCAV